MIHKADPTDATHKKVVVKMYATPYILYPPNFRPLLPVDPISDQIKGHQDESYH